MKRYSECEPVIQRPASLDPADSATVEELSPDEQAFLDAYRQLPSVPRIAVRAYVLRRDLRLARALYDRVFLNWPPR